MVVKENNIIHWYKFNESVGTPSSTQDSGNPGGWDMNAYLSPTIVTPGIEGNCYEQAIFRKSWQYPSPTAISTPLSFCVWVQCTQTDWNPSSINAPIFVNNQLEGRPVMRFSPFTRLQVEFAFSTVTISPYASIFNDPGVWHLLVAVYDDVTGGHLYWDGTEIWSDARTDWRGNTSDTQDFGIRSLYGGTCPGPIRYDQFRIYNVALDQDDVTALYNGGEGDFGHEPPYLPNTGVEVISSEERMNIISPGTGLTVDS